MTNKSGNVLFLILIAVALFAALAYTVTQSSRSGGDGLGKDKIKVEIANIGTYATNIESAISRLQLISQCGVGQISFNNAIISGYAHTPVSLNKCRVFHVDGGAIPYIEPDPKWLDTSYAAEAGYGEWVFTGDNIITEAGSTLPEVTAILPYVREDYCQKMAQKFYGRATYHTDLADFGLTKYTGTYGTDTIGDASEFKGEHVGCFEAGAGFTNTGSHHFYHVLIIR